MRIIEGHLCAVPAQIGIVVARWNHFIVDSLEQGALDALRRHGVIDDNITIVRVPGAFELPVAVARLAATQRFAALIALGAVIRGGTPHFEYVANECVKGIAQVSLAQTLPIAFGVLTVDNLEQAIERAGTKGGNKGAEAALSALEMMDLFRQLDAER